jgi:hypothetical protein
LADDDLACRRFESLPDSHRRRWVISIEDASAPTRQRRIDKAIAALHAEAASA